MQHRSCRTCHECIYRKAMKRAQSLLPLALLFTLSACESIFGPEKKSLEPLTELPRPLSVSEQHVIQGSNHFAFGLLREVSARDTASNLFLSPLSASMALGMTMNGARGDTFDGMRSALGFAGMAQDDINASYRSLIDLLRGLDGGVEMRIANALWARQGFPLRPEFVSSSHQFFDAETRELDFSDPASVGIINQWVNQGTNGRIPTILEQINSNTVLYLMNAIYFKGSWTKQFDPRRTADAPFRRADGTEQPVRMMSVVGANVLAHQNSDVQIVDLPYSRGAFSMTLLLPGHGRSLDSLVGMLDSERWSDWMGRLSEQRLDVFLPRFKLEYEQSLNETLKALGMDRAFLPGGADFTGMSPLGRDLFIDEVTQKTFIEVNEEGTEAAAVTSVGMGVVSLPPSFRADRPFLVVIRERLSGTILFIGTIGAPPAG
jgi:serine protease inhibitor